MNISRLLSIVLLFISAHVAVAQQANDSVKSAPSPAMEGNLSYTEYAERYNKMKSLYLKSLDSKSSLYRAELTKEFKRKVNFDGTDHEYDALIAELKKFINEQKEGNDPLMQWIHDNLSTTKFTTFEEAEIEYQELLDAQTAEFEDNREFYEYVAETVRIAGSGMFSDIVQDVIKNHPGKFHY